MAEIVCPECGQVTDAAGDPAVSGRVLPPL